MEVKDAYEELAKILVGEKFQGLSLDQRKYLRQAAKHLLMARATNKTIYELLSTGLFMSIINSASYEYARLSAEILGKEETPSE